VHPFVLNFGNIPDDEIAYSISKFVRVISCPDAPLTYRKNSGQVFRAGRRFGFKAESRLRRDEQAILNRIATPTGPLRRIFEIGSYYYVIIALSNEIL
jgi:hypothetical protein